MFRDMRLLDPGKLEGFCGTCQYRELCKGGCTIVRLVLGGGMYAQNAYCAYYPAMQSQNAVRPGDELPR